jgi:hypothetical protein
MWQRIYLSLAAVPKNETALLWQLARAAIAALGLRE